MFRLLISSVVSDKKHFWGIISVIFCNIIVLRAIIVATMVGAMAKLAERTENNDLVQRAKTQAESLGRLYEMYYERIFRFCVHRLFNKEIAEDVTSAVFLNVARGIRNFEGRSEQDFRNWLYAIAANQANAYIRKSSRRTKLLAEAAGSMVPATASSTNKSLKPDWPGLYTAILRLKPRHQTIVTLRFFENFSYQQIAQILNVKEANVRVTLHRILNKLRNQLQTVYDGEI